MIKAGIFDLDDTLYQYEDINKIAIRELCTYTCNLLNIERDLFYKAFEYGRNSTKSGLKDCAAQHNRMIYMQKTLEFLGINSISYSLEMYDTYWNSILEHMHLNTQAVELFDYLRSTNIKIAICTDLTAHIQHRKVRRLGINKYIDCIVTSEEAGEEKPSNKMFQMCLDKLNVKSDEAFFVGDNFQKDVMGASHSGIIPIWYNPNERKGENDDIEYNEIKELIDIKEILKKAYL
ncbi:HAD family hydrolase [Paenibacillus apiarius]|uniref:HAD-IA family hydrolase n=1 Tax=Paenibacillus apiarius TaxID=46240 RepID=A0ABT4E0M1_9BACL|nr:HAD-IA family hydrolase [Paenibacillus apiarius]MCY9517642.1 HAD-IA family hydrolase [Paenibacillus apiarius]MCY9523163.1 HAD-IA family hydrolase [Paenibacillus apiarius]MCY9555648.1 HAD-IA family hydrolase [Paenibacillus apiarius]MCY9561125.1 HAD-IA family hydrolase [Paenibacillus apiarius]MCY9682335.1 HAD-IA family hydrolase [Paenibacillus apiarius]